MSVLQITSLLDFLEGQPELALGRCTRTKEGRNLSKRLWEECAIILNNVSADCVQKTAEQWRMFYNDYKYKMLRKIKNAKSEKIATGGGPPTSIPLTSLQERLYNILGKDVGEPLPGVRLNPFSKIENEDDTPTNYVNIITDHTIEMPHTSDILNLPLSIESDEKTSGDRAPSEPSEQMPASQPGTSRLAREPDRSQAASESLINSEQPTLKRRRYKQQKSTRPEPDETLARATATLQSIEQLSAQATREQAQATNRLAAALEAISDRLKEPIKIIMENSSMQRKGPNTETSRKRRVIFDSESD